MRLDGRIESSLGTIWEWELGMEKEKEKEKEMMGVRKEGKRGGQLEPFLPFLFLSSLTPACIMYSKYSSCALFCFSRTS